jgi:hypothetical protein
MTRLRRVLVPFTAIWLTCQVGTIAVVPVALWFTAPDQHADECTCGHGLGAICPMHHKPSSGLEPCAMRPANGSGAAVLTTLVGITGLVAELARSIQPPMSSASPNTTDVQVAGERPVPPDPPPPRV